MKRVLALFVVALMTGNLAPASAGRTMTECSLPRADWSTASPEDVDLDAEALQDAIDFARPRNTQEIAVYRHGCLVAAERWFTGNDERFEGWSMSKSVTAIATGRAITLGLLDTDDPIGRYIEAADKEHSRITVRDLLTMTSGLHWNLWRDYNIMMRDRVKDALSLRFDHRPGVWFEYAQSPVALLAKVVEEAAGRDFQDFIQEELFGPVGIAREDWTWIRDSAGNTEGFRGLSMAVDDWSRLGHLMMSGGVWRGERLLDAGWVKAALTPRRTNPGYGYLFWLNEGDRYVAPTVYSRDERDHRHIESAPTGMYFMAGIQEQRVWVIPSLDLVVVRIGGSGGRDPDTRSSVFTAASGEFEHEFFRLLMKAVEDRSVPDPGPYRYSDPVPRLDPNYGIVKSTTQPDDIVAGFGGP